MLGEAGEVGRFRFAWAFLGNVCFCGCHLDRPSFLFLLNSFTASSSFPKIYLLLVLPDSSVSNCISPYPRTSPFLYPIHQLQHHLLLSRFHTPVPHSHFPQLPNTHNITPHSIPLRLREPHLHPLGIKEHIHAPQKSIPKKHWNLMARVVRAARRIQPPSAHFLSGDTDRRVRRHNRHHE